ncbi:serpin 1-like protein [Dinothrombium tinctorium]|uniref:Serpin 1-like protein n=1 Tax=Dinothrombium tinctorium TaxID=1965070 RepID=A0A3S3PP96_9ACAR|nr:serpin 1-like protein [Dinothrombium tinctorium]
MTLVLIINPIQFAIGQFLNADFVKSLNEFSFEFFRNTDISDKNAISSPLSVALCLMMLLEGANGRTEAQLKNVMHLSNDDGESIQSNIKEVSIFVGKKLMKNVFNFQILAEYTHTEADNLNHSAIVSIANALLASKHSKIRDEYKTKIANLYRALVDNVDFATNGKEIKDKINTFVREKTRGEITNFLVDNLPENSILFLLNTIYFKDQWKYKFNKRSTKKRKFYNYDGTESKVDTMSQLRVKYMHHFDDHKQRIIVELPYLSNTSMVLFVPKQRDGLQEMLNELNDDEIENLLSKLSLGKITLRIPKFESNYRVNAKEVLQRIGLKCPFASNADFSRIASGVYVSYIHHEAIVKVDESGTVASAATGAGMSRSIEFTEEVNVDHPFMFLIRDKNNELNLFYGVINKLN